MLNDGAEQPCEGSVWAQAALLLTHKINNQTTPASIWPADAIVAASLAKSGSGESVEMPTGRLNPHSARMGGWRTANVIVFQLEQMLTCRVFM
jgi:hypothetical protein